MVAVRVRVREGAAHAVPDSLLQDLHDLEAATSSSSSTLVRERNLHVLVYEGTCLKLLPLQHS
jgi:hypothetical protein